MGYAMIEQWILVLVLMNGPANASGIAMLQIGPFPTYLRCQAAAAVWSTAAAGHKVTTIGTCLRTI